MVRKPAKTDDNDENRIFTDKELHRVVADLQVDVWIGKDKENPSITMRLDRVENTIAEIKKLKWYLVGAIFAMIGGIIINFIRH
jgi:hypothetical protein